MGVFENLRLSGIDNVNKSSRESYIPIGGGEVHRKDASDLHKKITEYESNYLDTSARKSIGREDTAYQETVLGMMNTNPDYKDKKYYMQNGRDLHKILKGFGNNIIINAIINTRADQVSMYCQPARYTQRGKGFRVRLKDLTKLPGANEKKEMERIEDFITNTSTRFDIERDSFYELCKKIIRDTLIYDQVNIEKNIDRKSNKLISFTAVDPTTIYYKSKDNKFIQGKKKPKYVQVIEDKIVNEYTSREMIMGIRRPRTDIESNGYGLSELEIALKEVIAHENTEDFNDRFFSHGGTTRGLLLIKHDEQQSRSALDAFKREWKSSLSGINGSWQIPVVSADDAKFINMTPTANDMQFEKWLNYLINVISSLFSIDPSEINFPNRGGATGSKSNSLNEGDSSKKTKDSQNKGLQPLLRFIESIINKHIIAEFGDKYTFEFEGGDSTGELEKLQILKLESEIYKTPDIIAKERGYEHTIPGGDIIQNGVALQRAGQLEAQKNYEEEKEEQQAQEMDNKLNDNESNRKPKDSEHYSTDNDTGVGKDGQEQDSDNTNSYDQTAKNIDWKL